MTRPQVIKLIAVVALCACHATPSPAGTPAPPIAAAVEAYARYDLGRSRQLYREVAERGALEDRVAARRALAGYAWRFDRDADAALRELDRGLGLATASSELYSMRADILREAGRFQPALADARRAIATSTGPGARTEAELAAARTVLATALATSQHGGALDRASLREARALAIAILDRQPGRPEPSETLLAIAVLLDDGSTLLRAWRSYFLVTDVASINPVLRDAYTTLRGLAASWHDRPLTAPERADLAVALARSRFYDVAAWVAGTNQALGDIVAYQQYISAIAAVDADFYPRIANGLRDYASAYDAALEVPARRLWSALARNDAYTSDGFFALIKERFGAEGYIGSTVGYHGLLLGHIIHDEPRQVEQYGRSAEFRLIIIDRMISRDFTSWYGTTNVGGWGTSSTMFQVRAAYLDEPFKRLEWVADPQQRAKLVTKIATAASEDRARCADDRYADPPSVAQRIKLAAADQIYAALNSRGLTGQDLALAFVSESLRLNVEATVFAHEGRHSLDQHHFKDQFATWSDDERELRAKLSEVAFATNPMLALTGSILGARLDETQGHGLANRRFRTLVVDWMAAHRGEIAGLDEAEPLVLQLDRLTNEQLVGIVRAADPMATAAR